MQMQLYCSKLGNKYDLVERIGTGVSIIVIGMPGVGVKDLMDSFLAINYLYDDNPNEYVSFTSFNIKRADSYRKQVKVNGKLTMVDVYDLLKYTMVGNVDLAELWIQKSHSYLLVFKKTDKQSFDVLETYINQIYQVRNCRIGTIPIVLLANEDPTTEAPIELVSEQDVQTFVTKYKIDRYYNGYGTITGLFNELCTRTWRST
jgi:GTPase SAR1 family protein